MKNLRLLCATVLLALAFTLSAYADDGHVCCPAITAPAPQPTLADDMNHSVTQLAVSIITSVLSLS